MTRQKLTELNLGQSLDDISNIDPRGYGVCKILYKYAREYTGAPLCMNAAKKLVDTLKTGDTVFIMTGFVLRPYNRAETDGIVGAMLLCRALVKAFGVRPVIICPEDNRIAVENMAPCMGLELREDRNAPVGSMGMEIFTKDASLAESEADNILSKWLPSALISIECPGANSEGVYHNAVGLDVTELEAKQDPLFNKIKEMGILNIAVGDLGNEMGMGTLAPVLEKHIPYAGKGRCRCGCGGGIAAQTSADDIITATTSDWGCYALIAAIGFLVGDIDVMHTPRLEEVALRTACESGMIDMSGESIPAIDGFGLEMNKSVVSLMRESVAKALSVGTSCDAWFEKVDELGFFEDENR